VHLRSAKFPWLVRHFGRSVIDDRGIDQHNVLPSVFSGSEAPYNTGVPQIYFCENILPSAEGVQSVGYERLNYTNSGLRLLPCEDSWLGEAGFVSSDSISGAPHTPLGENFSVASLHERHFAFSRETKKLYEINCDSQTLVEVSVDSCVPQDKILGICAANNFLILYSSRTIYWSSTHPGEELVFSPTSSTLAGSAIPTDLKADIIYLYPVDDGFFIATKENWVLAFYGTSDSCPWDFREIHNASGIKHPWHVGWDTNSHTLIAYTHSGLQEISPQKASLVFPTLSQFLRQKEIDYYLGPQTDFTKVDTQTNWSSQSQWEPAIPEVAQIQTGERDIKVKVSFLDSAYYAISYGDSEKAGYEFCAIYDLALKRWGKLRFQHHSIFLHENQIYLQSLNGIFKLQRKAGNGVLILGRYQLQRTSICTIQEIEIESASNLPYQVSWLYAVNGLTWKEDALPMQVISSGELNTYHLRYTARTHSLKFVGAFDLSSIVLTFNVAGFR